MTEDARAELIARATARGARAEAEEYFAQRDAATADPSVPVAAVRIVAGTLRQVGASAHAVITDLAAAGWLHDPAELDAARARLDRVRTICRDRYFLAQGGERAVFVDEVLAELPTRED